MSSKCVFVIRKLWTDSMENSVHAAYGYAIVGYVDTEEEANEIVKNGLTISSTELWAFQKDMPEYEIKKIEKYKELG